MAFVEVWASRHTLRDGFLQVVLRDCEERETVVFPAVYYRLTPIVAMARPREPLEPGQV